MPENEAAEVLEQDRPKVIDAEEQASAEAVKAGHVDPAADAEKTDEESHKRKGGYLRKLEKKDEQIEILVEALRKVGGLPAEAAQKQAEPEDKPPEKPVRPKIADFEDFAKYDAALSKYEEDRDSYSEKQIAYRLRQERQVQAQQSQKQREAQGFAAKVAEAKKVHADFEQVAFSEDTPLSPAMAEAITDSEHSTDILYFLGKNQKQAERIAKLGPIAAIREIGKIESLIADKNAAAGKEDQEEPEPSAASRAPRPPQPVRRPSAVNAEPEDKDDYATWLRKREAQLKAK